MKDDLESSGPGHVCDICGTIEAAHPDLIFIRQDDGWLCADCWRNVPKGEIERVHREKVLRGVPL